MARPPFTFQTRDPPRYLELAEMHCNEMKIAEPRAVEEKGALTKHTALPTARLPPIISSIVPLNPSSVRRDRKPAFLLQQSP